MQEWYMLESNKSGRGFRYQIGDAQSRSGYFTFQERTADFISAGQLTGQVVRITEKEYLEALHVFLTWLEMALKGIKSKLESIAA